MLKIARLIPALLGMIFATCAHADTAPNVPLVPPRVDTVTPHGVSMASGAFSYEKEDLKIGDGEIGISFDRSYSTGQSGVNYELPFGWDHNFDIHITDEKKQDPLTFTANTLHPYAPGQWPFLYHVIVGSRSIPFEGGTSAQSDPCPPEDLGGGTVCPTGGFVGSYSVSRPGGESLSYAGDESTGHFTFTDTDGTVIYFGSRTDPDGTDPDSAPLRAIYEIKPDGVRYDFHYDDGKLSEITSNNGYAISFNYGTSGSAQTVCVTSLARNYVGASYTCKSTDLAVSYSYDSPSTYTAGLLLTSAEDVLGNSETYSYGQYDHMTCLKKVGEASCRVSNTFDVCTLPTNIDFDPGLMHLKDVVGVQTLSTGEQYTFQIAHPSSGTFYCPIALPNGTPTPVGGSVTNPDGGTETYSVVPVYQDSLPSSVTDGLGRVTTYTYVHAGYGMGDLVTSETKPSGLKTAYTYDTRGNPKTITKTSAGGDTLTAGYTYPVDCDNPATCNKPTAVTDWNGNETDWTYASWGGVASELQPAPTTGAAQPLKLTAYVQKSAYVLNSSGALVSTGQPIWLIDTETVCQTVPGSGTPTCDASAPKTVTAYQYGANGTADNLLVRGVAVTSDGQTQRTCYGYDAYGNRISETKPLGTGSACS